MDGWAAIAGLGAVCRPFDGPPPALGDRYSPFRAPWRSTVALLSRELHQLGAQRIVVELAIEERQLRADGMPRAGSRLASPAVRISFESMHGPLRYETGLYNDWEDNVRAIALSLEALRKVDRYGVSTRGEQYRGWRQLPVGTDPADAIQTGEQARALIDSYAPGERLDAALRAALLATHPDRGGDATEFRKVQRAREVLGV